MVRTTAAATVKRSSRGAAVDYPLAFPEYLAAAETAGKRKGERTRDRLKLATARLLEKNGFRELRVTDINELAGVSNALFYVYFTNKEVIAHEVLADFLIFLETYRDRDPEPASAEQSIYVANLRYAQIFQANAGLMRCVFQFIDAFPDFAHHWHKWSERWREGVLAALARSTHVAFADPIERGHAVLALGAMVDAVLRLALVEREPWIIASGLGSDVEALARLLTRLWMRALFDGAPR